MTFKIIAYPKRSSSIPAAGIRIVSLGAIGYFSAIGSKFLDDVNCYNFKSSLFRLAYLVKASFFESWNYHNQN